MKNGDLHMSGKPIFVSFCTYLVQLSSCQVNGQNIENKQQKEVVAVLRQINGPMALEVFRYAFRL